MTVNDWSVGCLLLLLMLLSLLLFVVSLPHLEALDLLHLAVPYHPRLVGDRVHKEGVVRDADDGPVEGLDALGEGRDTLEIEVVGGLVEHQHVGLLEAHRREGHATPLPARQRRRGCVLEVRWVLLSAARHAAVSELAPEFLRVVVGADALGLREETPHVLQWRDRQVWEAWRRVLNSGSELVRRGDDGGDGGGGGGGEGGDGIPVSPIWSA